PGSDDRRDRLSGGPRRQGAGEPRVARASDPVRRPRPYGSLRQGPEQGPAQARRPRHSFARGPGDVPFQQDQLSPRRDPRPDFGAAERGDPDPDGRNDRVLSADADRHDLWNEFQMDPGAHLGLGLHLCNSADAGFSRAALPLLQAPWLAVGERSALVPILSKKSTTCSVIFNES